MEGKESFVEFSSPSVDMSIGEILTLLRQGNKFADASDFVEKMTGKETFLVLLSPIVAGLWCCTWSLFGLDM